MSSRYIPLVLRLEVRDHSSVLPSFYDNSETVTVSPCAGERTRRRLISSGMKKRNSPTKKDIGEAPIGDMTHEPTHVYHRGRRTYSEVVVSTYDGEKFLETPSSSAAPSEISSGSRPAKIDCDEYDLDEASYYYGNPLTEKTEGIMHFFKYSDDKLLKSAQCKMLCMFAVPAQVTVREIIIFIGAALSCIECIKVVRDSSPNQYMLIIKFKEHNDAVTFYEQFNNKPFNELEAHRCVLLFVDRIECSTSDELLASSSCLTELPTCTVCLEKMDESVLAILCNHSFHATCLEQWADVTCPVCRYVQTPEVVAEQRCSDCGQSTDLWICLICGNIGCGRYASQHAQKHWELTSHTYSLKVGGERVWDYAGDNYVHRLIENDSDGKLVEYQREERTSDGKQGKDDKLEGIKLEYTLLLTSQLEDQRKYFEGRLKDVEKAMTKMEKVAYAQVESLEKQVNEQSAELKAVKSELETTKKSKMGFEKKLNSNNDKLAKISTELRDEREINKMLRNDIVIWKRKHDDLENGKKQDRLLYESKIEDLQSQVNDLMMHFESQAKISEQLMNGNVTKEELEGGAVQVNDNKQNSKKSHRKGKNK